MAAALTLYQSSIGKKFVMAVTGFIGYGFVAVHMVGNLKVFQGREHFNEYAEFLRIVGEPIFPHTSLLWIFRIVLLAAVILHVWSAIELTRMDIAGRPRGYKVKKTRQANFASMTLRYGGVALLLFIIFHLLHFTSGTVHPNFIKGDAYHNVVVGFQNPFMVGLYLVAVAALGMHLFHGVWSMFQTLGLNNKRSDPFWRGLAALSGVGLFLGFATVPIAVAFGMVQ